LVIGNWSFFWSLVFAEIELLRGLFAERVPEKSLVALRAQIIAKVFISRLDFLSIIRVVFHLAQELTDRFHVVVVQIRLGDLRGIVGSEHFDFDDEALILAGT